MRRAVGIFLVIAGLWLWFGPWQATMAGDGSGNMPASMTVSCAAAPVDLVLYGNDPLGLNPKLGAGDGVVAPPLVASLGGPWTIRHIAPLVDRVELKFGNTTRSGDLSMDALAAVTLGDLAANVAAVREVAPDVPIGAFAMIAVGSDDEVGAVRGRVGSELYGSFVGSRQQVLEALDGLADVGVDRVQVSELVKGSILRLRPGG